MNLNSQLAQRMISSENRLKCIIRMEMALISSTQKSRSDTPSMELRVMPSKPSFRASKRRSVGYVVPAKAQEPMGQTFIRFRQSPRRPRSRRSIMA